FLEPVNPDEVPGYTDVIKEPMDFAKMEKRLHSGAYRRQDEFQRDLLLVTGNAQTFNQPGSIYSNEAARLE
ncbi:Bromodomain-containing protein, partial [Tilletiopsis washingtonensis]